MHVRRCRSTTTLSVLLARLSGASPLRREEMRKAYIKSSGCRAIDTTVATKLASQRAFSPGGEVRFAWYPQTFAVPSELPALRRAGASEPGARWILKDPTLNQGKGVRMLRSLDELGALLLPPRPGAAPPALVVQRNVARPLTVGGYKFHYRLYPLLSSACAASPRLWIYPHAAARFSTVAYRASAAEKQAHVTNSAVNEGRLDYCAAPPWRLRTLRAVVAELRTGPPPPGRAAPRLEAVLARSFGVLSAAFSEGVRRHRRRGAAATAGAAASSAASGAGPGCHGVYGVDLMLDEALRVWLIEVQIGPQMDCACPQDELLKEGLLRALLQHSLPPPPNPLGDGAPRAEAAASSPGSCADEARLSRAALPANVSLALALQAAAAAAAASDPEDAWQPMLSIPLEAAADDGPSHMRTNRSDVGLV